MRNTVIESSGYKVFVGNFFSSELESIIQKKYKDCSIYILVDENTMEHCFKKLISEVKSLKEAEVLQIDSGEENKTIEICTQLWGALADSGADRNSLLINLGGGVIGDMGGFVASTFKRGFDFINIPTTLLSQVDASVGGKLGVDLYGLKNLVGVFNFPKAVFVYPEFIDTLPEKEVLSGYAEVIKHALIYDAKYWEEIKSAKIEDTSDLLPFIHRSIEIKNEVVLKDPEEKNIRKILNYGHTIGHAIETHFLLKGNKITHGEAVAAGMIAEAYLSKTELGLSDEKQSEIEAFIKKKFPEILIKDEDLAPIMGYMKNDKKNKSGKISFSLLKDIGVSSFDHYLVESKIIEAIKYYTSAY